MAGMQFCGPYLDDLTAYRWLKGNHHGHTTRSDGGCLPAEEIEAYRRAGYDYLALSEHDLFCDPHEDQTPDGPLLLPAAEITSRAGQTLMFLGADPDIPRKRRHSMAELARIAASQDVTFIVDHPNWLYQANRLHAEFGEIVACPEIQHVEIYTGVIERLAGDPFAVDVWDALLSSGKRMFGHAVDDQHRPSDRFKGWNCVQIPVTGKAPTSRDILDALSNGRFVAAKGVKVHSIGTSQHGDVILTDSDADAIAWRTNHGRLLCRTEGGSGEMTVKDFLVLIDLELANGDTKSTYLRIEYEGSNSRRAWSQPFWLSEAIDQ